MLRKKILIFFFLLALMTLAPSQGQCENWKEFFRDGDTTRQYDKNSVHYPKTKKNIFGITVQDKDIVNVWTREINKKDGEIGKAEMVRIYCAERECVGCGVAFSIIDPRDGKLRGDSGPIEPGSPYENLLKKVCP